jgi:hypothetical protein
MTIFIDREIQYIRDCIAALPDNDSLKRFKGDINVTDTHIDIADGDFTLYVDEVIAKYKTVNGVREVHERVYSATRWVVSGYSYGQPDDVFEQELIPQDNDFHRVLSRLFAEPLYQQIYYTLNTFPRFTGGEVFADGQ